MELWIPITVAAAFFQNLRSALQKHLKGRLSTSGAAYSRFLYALPLALVYLGALHMIAGLPLPSPSPVFFLYCTLGGVSQIMFTVTLLWMFSFRSFTVGTVFSKLEVVMIAVLGALILGDGLGSVAIFAIALSAAGVVAMSLGRNRLSAATLVRGLTEKATLAGLACAAWLGGSVVFFRGASLSLGADSFVMAAGYTLAVSLAIQTAIMGTWMVLREPDQLRQVLKHWRAAALVGVAGVLASIAWLTAFTIQNASYVRAVGQVELLFTYATTLYFREKVSTAELVGAGMVAAAILLILLGG